ncbi:MAG: hypothetical protein MHPSP_002738 [Paramarteilia canceri]
MNELENKERLNIDILKFKPYSLIIGSRKFGLFDIENKSNMIVIQYLIVENSGLFYQAFSSHTITDITGKRIKISKKRINIVLCENASESIKILASGIGISKKPRCFKNFSSELFADNYNK